MVPAHSMAMTKGEAKASATLGRAEEAGLVVWHEEADEASGRRCRRG